MRVVALSIGYLALCWLLGCARPVDQDACARGVLPSKAADEIDSVEAALRLENWDSILSLDPDPDTISCCVRALMANPLIWHPEIIHDHGGAWLAEHGGKQ